MATASSISPSGMQLAGKYGIGVLSIASNSTEGLQALPTQWGVRRGGRRAARPDRRPNELAGADGVPPRRDREQARNEAVLGLQRWHNEYNVLDARPPRRQRTSTIQWELLDHDHRRRRRRRRRGRRRNARRSGRRRSATCYEIDRRLRRGARLRPRLGEPEATFRSWELVAKYVIPEVNGMLGGLREIAGLPPRQPGRADGRRHRGRDAEDHGPRGRGQGDGDHDGSRSRQAAADKSAPKDAVFRPGAL